jgi:hypothetical protein
LLEDPSQILGNLHAGMAHPRELLASDGLFASGLNTGELQMTQSNSYIPLPPPSEIQPAIDHYFSHVNSLLPLFSQESFSRMLQEYYLGTSEYPLAIWAAVNVVLALATRLPTSPSSELDLGSEDKHDSYVNNAQSVLPQLVAREADILSLQVVLGLVITYHTLKDSRPAVVLLGTAVRFAHILRLHTRQGRPSLSPDDSIQRQRVFWITYILDRDICLRYHTPSVLADADIDLDLPSENPRDGAGNIHTIDGQSRINFFRIRLHLAHIQGRV